MTLAELKKIITSGNMAVNFNGVRKEIIRQWNLTDFGLNLILMLSSVFVVVAVFFVLTAVRWIELCKRQPSDLVDLAFFTAFVLVPVLVVFKFFKGRYLLFVIFNTLLIGSVVFVVVVSASLDLIRSLKC